MNIGDRYRELLALLYLPELPPGKRAELEREHAQKVAAVMARDEFRKTNQQGLAL